MRKGKKELNKMKFIEKNHLFDVDEVCLNQGKYLVNKCGLLYTYSSDLKEEGWVSDYMANAVLLVDGKSDYLVEHTQMRKIKVRDRKTLEPISTMEEYEGGLPYRVCFSLDGQSLFVILGKSGASSVPAILANLVERSYQFRLLRFTLPGLEFAEEIDLSDLNPVDIRKLESENCYLIQDQSGQMYFMDESGAVDGPDLPPHFDKDSPLFYNSARKEFYRRSPEGFVVYSREMKELDSLFLFGDDVLKMSSLYSFNLKKVGKSDPFEEPSLEEKRFNIDRFGVYDHDHVVFNVNDIKANTSKLVMYSFEKKQQEIIADVVGFIQDFYIMGNTIAFLERRTLHFLEVENG